jgi:hypothetical protein
MMISPITRKQRNKAGHHSPARKYNPQICADVADTGMLPLTRRWARRASLICVYLRHLRITMSKGMTMEKGGTNRTVTAHAQQ